MRRTGSIVLLLLVWTKPAPAQQTCGGCSIPSPGLATTKADDPRAEEVKRLDADLDSAWLRGDKRAVAAALAEGMISVDPTGEVTEREQILKSVKPSPAAMKASVSAADVRVMFFGDTAIVTSKKTRKWEAGDRTRSKDYRETNTYVRREGRWLLIASQDSEEPPPYFAKDVAFDLPFDERHALGDKKASVVLYEFSDYQCPHCRRFAAQTLPRVLKEYVDAGRVAFVLRDHPMENSHPRALAAATAAQCAASEGKFREMNERLLRDPVELSDADLARDAREVGIDPARFERCFQEPATAQEVRAGVKEAESFGIIGTPIFVIGVRRPAEPTVRALRMIEGAFPYGVFKTTLDGVIRSTTP